MGERKTALSAMKSKKQIGLSYVQPLNMYIHVLSIERSETISTVNELYLSHRSFYTNLCNIFL